MTDIEVMHDERIVVKDWKEGDDKIVTLRIEANGDTVAWLGPDARRALAARLLEGLSDARFVLEPADPKEAQNDGDPIKAAFDAPCPECGAMWAGAVMMHRNGCSKLKWLGRKQEEAKRA